LFEKKGQVIKGSIGRMQVLVARAGKNILYGSIMLGRDKQTM
jgi:hypothetical protein